MSSRLTAKDVKNQEFNRKMRGYDPEQVDMFLTSVSDEIGRLNLENGKRMEETGSLRKELGGLRSSEDALRNTLVAAQAMSDQMKERADKKGQEIVQEARRGADRILKDAQERLARVESDITRTTLDRETFEHRLRGVLDQHLALLEMRREARDNLDNLRMLPSRIGSDTG